ncbi:MAG: FliI/YscN family ATPase [Phycisphaerales bacterium]|nr:FliI/YscN family ATPase [Phycisphaerales bacterium]
MFASAMQTIASVQPVRVTGRVAALRGLTVLVHDLPVAVGALVELPRCAAIGRAAAGASADRMVGEVVGFTGRHTIVMMLGQSSGIRVGDEVVAQHAARTAGVGASLLGRVVNGLCEPIDGRGALLNTVPRGIEPPPRPPMQRKRIHDPLHTGVRAMDLMTTLGRGQRLGIFAGPGVGKSTLLSSIARGTSADVVVLALIGERGREVQDFLEGVLGEAGMRRSVVVASTSDESPLMRIRAALVASTIAEHFRDAGKHVLLMMDSVTRFAQAQRQVGLSVGEPPASKGYTPSVFANLARLLERAGQFEPERGGGPQGSVTGLYTVLVEGDDMTEPVADAARGILDGHVILSRALAQRGHYPAIDVLDSISRVADEVCDPAHIGARRTMVRVLASYRKSEDLIQIGAYAKGSDGETDLAIDYSPRINELLRQTSAEDEAFSASRERMVRLAMEINARAQAPRR